ncbi:MAG TPA: hypothetical protein PK620_12410, partial [Denitromonas sp.]|nr:hypothetical protein [Denitromonas sp.]
VGRQALQAHGRFNDYRPFAAFHLESVDLVAQLLWVAPQAAASALLLPQPGLVLHFGPFVPREISIGRMVARLVCVLFK